MKLVIQPPKIELGPMLDMRAIYRTHKHTSTYQADIVSDGRGNVSGGGTRALSYRTEGLAIEITNRTTEVRTYEFNVVRFINIERKVIGRQIPGFISRLKPGYTATAEFPLLHGEKLTHFVLEDLIVKDERGQEVERFTPNLRLYDYLPRLKYGLQHVIGVLLGAWILWVAYRVVMSFAGAQH